MIGPLASLGGSWLTSQDQASMLMEEELKESTKFINLLEVIMENGAGEAKFEIHTKHI